MNIQRSSIIIFLFVLYSSSFAQVKDTAKVDYLAHGFGFGKSDHISLSINYTYIEESVFQFSINSNTEFNILGGDSDYIYAYSLAYGFLDQKEKHFGGIFIGPSLVYSEIDNSYGPGLNLSAQFFVEFIEVSGIGVDAFLNLNSVDIFWGIRLALFWKSLK